MEEAGQVGDFWFWQRLHDAAAIWIFVIEPRQREPAQILDDEERVGIDSVGVEKIVLHAPYDSAEGRDVEPQHPIGIHSLQGSSDA